MSALELRGLTKRWNASDARPAVDTVSLHVDAGEVLALVGESGAGKSTLARMVAGFTSPSAGAVLVDGVELPAERTRADRARVQLVGQNPRAALNRRRTIGHALEQAARVHAAEHDDGPSDRVELALADVGLTLDHRARRPAAVSGGELARAVLARALLCTPSVLVLDEPTASLDARTKSAIVDLLRDLASRRCLAILVITHEVPIARRLADRTAVMQGGVIVESGPTEVVLHHPAHDYTRALVAAVLTVRGSARGLGPAPGAGGAGQRRYRT